MSKLSTYFNEDNYKPILEIIFSTHEEYLKNIPIDHEQSELYMYMAHRISNTLQGNVRDNVEEEK